MDLAETPPLEPTIRDSRIVAPQPAASGDIALAGPDGKQARDLLQKAKAEGQRLIAELTDKAIRRINPTKPPKQLFTAAEQAELAELLHTIHTTAELLGRASVRLRADQAKAFGERHLRKFSDEPTRFHVFADPIPLPPSPEAALEYFRKLVPGITAQVKREGTKRKTFSVYALDADKQLLGIVKNVLTEALTGEEDKPETVISDLLKGKESKLRISRDAYSELIVRTNLLSAYTEGMDSEIREPEMQEIFPYWRYVGIEDGRQGKDHQVHFDKYFPSSVSFSAVRGPRVFNCRCVPLAIDKIEAAALKRQGVL